MQVIEVLGRIFLSALFLIEGINKIFNYEGTTQYMESFGVPEYLAIPAIILEILKGCKCEEFEELKELIENN